MKERKRPPSLRLELERLAGRTKKKKGVFREWSTNNRVQAPTLRGGGGFPNWRRKKLAKKGHRTRQEKNVRILLRKAKKKPIHVVVVLSL